MDEAFVLRLTDRMADSPMPPWRSRGEIVGGTHALLRAVLHRDRDDGILLVAEESGGGTLGCVLVMTRIDEFVGQHHAHVVVIAVAQMAEGRGIAGALMAAAEAWARDEGLRLVVVDVFERNHHAFGFCEHLGYSTETRRLVKSL